MMVNRSDLADGLFSSASVNRSDLAGALSAQIYVWTIWGSQAAWGAGRAETNTERMIFRLVASEKMSNHSRKLQVEASGRLLEVRALKIDGPKMIQNVQNQSEINGAVFLKLYKLDLFL